MTVAWLPAVILAAVVAGGAPQQPGPPPLQSRSSTPADEHPAVVLRNHATSVLPQDGSGLYRFGEGAAIGEGIQIDEQFGDVTGYLTIKGPIAGGKPGISSYFLSQVEGGDGDLSFTTKAVHGISYSFDGKVVRGPGATRAQDGFYLMSGELILHDDTRQTTQRRTISLKLTAQH